MFRTLAIRASEPDYTRPAATATRANSALSWGCGYDTLDRLSSATKTGSTYGWTYDSNGNRTAQTGTSASTYTVAAASNHLSSISGALAWTYGYNAAGAVTSYSDRTMAYNNRGRMKSITVAGTITNYLYNPLGQMSKKSGGGRHLTPHVRRGGSFVGRIQWHGRVG